MKGYKFLLEGYKSQHGDFIYEVGKTYVHDGEIEMCKSGFHFSKKIGDAIRYVNGDICVEIEANGYIFESDDKCVCSEIKILRELDIEQVLEILSEDNDWRIRETVAENRNTPIKVLKKLSKDEDREVREYVVKNQKTPSGILVKLSEDKSWYVREGVARNLNTPIKVLEILSKDKELYVRGAIARNQNTPTRTLVKLSEDKSWHVREGAAENLVINK